MGDHQCACLSPEQHRESDVLFHYLGCLEYRDRKLFLGSLPPEEQKWIEEEMRRISKLREAFQADPERRYLVFRLESSLNRYFRRDPYQRTRKNTPTTGLGSVSPIKSAVADRGFGMKANVIYWKDSQPHAVDKLPGEFPDQMCSIEDLLYTRSEENPLVKACESGMIRYFHLPANNLRWAEVSRPFVETLDAPLDDR